MRTIIIVSVLLLNASLLQAQPLADHVPGDSILYAGWTGLDSTPKGMEGSHWEAILDHSHFREVAHDFLPKIMRRAAIADPRNAQDYDLAYGIVSPLLHHPTAFYIERFEVANDQPQVSAGIICQADTDADALDKRLALLRSKIDEAGVFEWKRSGSLIEIHVGKLEISPGDALAQSSELQAAVTQIPADSPVFAHVNFAKLLETIDRTITQNADAQAQAYWPKVRDALGIGGVKSASWCAHFDGRDWMNELFVSAPAPRQGLMSIKDLSGKLTPDALSAVPATADFVLATTLDLGKTLTAIHDSAAAVDPQFGHLFDQGLGALTLFIGRNFQRDVVEPFGPQWTLFTDPARNGNGLAGLTLVNQPKDIRKADGALTAMAIAISNTTAGLMRPYGISVPLERSKFGDVTVNYLGLPLISPSWAASGARLYAAAFPQVVASATKSAAAGKSIQDNDGFKAAIARLKVEQPTSLAYSDLRIGAAESYQSLMLVSRLIFGAADAWGVKAPEPVLPAYDDLVADLSPASAAGWVDDAGFHFKSISPFPGSELLNGGNSFALLNAAATFSGSLAPKLAEQRQPQTDNQLPSSPQMP